MRGSVPGRRRRPRGPATCNRCGSMRVKHERHAAAQYQARVRERGAHLEQFREEGQLQRLLQEGHARAAAGAALVADDALDRLHVPETPELEIHFHVHQLLAQVVGRPSARRCPRRCARTPAAGRVRARAAATSRARRRRPARHGRGAPDSAGIRRTGSALPAPRAARPGAAGSWANTFSMSAFLLPSRNSIIAVLQRLEARRRAEHVAEFQVVAGRQRLQHRPLLGQLLLDLLDAREDLLARVELVALQVRDRRAQFVDHQLHPQLGRLVLDDEQHFVVVRRVRQRLLRRQQRVQLQVAAVAQAIAQVGGDALLPIGRWLGGSGHGGR